MPIESGQAQAQAECLSHIELVSHLAISRQRGVPSTTTVTPRGSHTGYFRPSERTTVGVTNRPDADRPFDSLNAEWAGRDRSVKKAISNDEACGASFCVRPAGRVRESLDVGPSRGNGPDGHVQPDRPFDGYCSGTVSAAE